MASHRKTYLEQSPAQIRDSRRCPKARGSGSRRRAERPRASLHPAKNRRRSPYYPTESPRWRIGRRPTPSSRRGTARDAGRFRAPTRPRTVRNPLASPRRIVGRSLGPSFFSEFKARRPGIAIFTPSRVPRQLSIRAPQSPPEAEPQRKAVQKGYKTVDPTKFAARNRCSPLSSVRGAVGGDQRAPVDATSARFSLIDGLNLIVGARNAPSAAHEPPGESESRPAAPRPPAKSQRDQVA